MVVSASQTSNLFDGWQLNGWLGEGTEIAETMREDAR